MTGHSDYEDDVDNDDDEHDGKKLQAKFNYSYTET